MKRFIIVAVMTAFGATSFAFAQRKDSNHAGRISSGPWHMRRSTANVKHDRLMFIMDRTLNAAERDTLQSMFMRMPANTETALQDAILGAIDRGEKEYPNYRRMSSTDWATGNGMSSWQVREALSQSLDWREKGFVGMWYNHATVSQIMVVDKLVQQGGWADSLWATARR